MSDLEEITFYKLKVESLRREADKSTGALGETMIRLRDEFACETIEEGEALLKKIRKRAAKAKTAFTNSLDAFREEWKDLL